MTNGDLALPDLPESRSRVTYEAFQYDGRVEYAEALRRLMTFEERFNPAMRTLEQSFIATICGRVLHEVRFPETWWDAVLERWCPAWLRVRFPKWLEPSFVEVTSLAFYPDIHPGEVRSSKVDVEWFDPEWSVG